MSPALAGTFLTTGPTREASQLPLPAPPSLLSPPQFFVEPSGIRFLKTPRTPLQSWAPSLLRGCGSESRAVAVAGPLRPSSGSRPDTGSGLRAPGSRLPRLPARCCLPGCPAAAPPSPRPAPFPGMQPLLSGPEHPAAALQQSLTPALPVRTFPAGFPCSASPGSLLTPLGPECLGRVCVYF